MSRDLSEVYEAIKLADKEGRTEDVQKLAAYLESLPPEEGFDPRDLKTSLGGAATGAVAGAFGVPIVRGAINAASKVGAGVPIGSASQKVPMQGSPGQRYAAKTGYGAGPGETVREVVEEFKKAEGPIGKGKITSKIKGGPLGGPKVMEQIAAKEADELRFQQIRAANQMAAEKAKSVPGKIAAFGSGVVNYRLPIIGGTPLPIVGRGLAGAGAGIQATDMYNRYQQGDLPGAAISGIGSVGTAATLLPNPIAKGVGFTIGAGAEALNAYLDYLKNKAQQPQQEEQQQEQQMPVPMAQGGLVGGLDATYNMPLAGGASLSIGGPQQQPQFNPMVPGMADGGLASIGRETEEEKRRRMMRLGVSAQSLSPMQDRGPGAIPGSAMPFGSSVPPGVAARMQLEKSMGPGQARVGASGVGMALPNQQGVKMMPGQVDVGYNMPLGQGNLDISARRDINKQRPGMPQNYAANVNYTLPFAAGGYIKK
jgi:hypothetical protein